MPCIKVFLKGQTARNQASSLEPDLVPSDADALCLQATIYSLVGALNKIPVAVVGMLGFHEPTNPKNMGSIIIGLGAGVLFAQIKASGK